MLTQNMLWAIGLMALAAAFLFAEFLIPSAGLLGIGAAMAAIAALVLAYSESLTAGLAMTGVLAVGTPILLMTAIRVWPYTPIGRRILNLPPLEHEDDLRGGDELESDEGLGQRSERRRGLWDLENPYRSLLGKVGVARTNLLPSGQIEIEGKKYDAVALGMAVDSGQFVEVSSVDAGKIRVKLTSRRPAESNAGVENAQQGLETNAKDSDSGETLVDDWESTLSNRTLEDFDIEDLSDPLK